MPARPSLDEVGDLRVDPTNVLSVLVGLARSEDPCPCGARIGEALVPDRIRRRRVIPARTDDDAPPRAPAVPAEHRRQRPLAVLGQRALEPGEPRRARQRAQQPADLAQPELDVDREQRPTVFRPGVRDQREVQRDRVPRGGPALVGAGRPTGFGLLGDLGQGARRRRQCQQRAGHRVGAESTPKSLAVELVRLLRTQCLAQEETCTGPQLLLVGLDPA